MVTVLNPRSRKAVQEEIRIMQEASKKHLRSKKTALAFLYKHGFVTKSGKLAKRYGG